MSDTIKKLVGVVGVVVTFLLLLFLSYRLGERQGKKSHSESIITQTDTITRIDTIRLLEPKYIAKKITDTIFLPIHDTIDNTIVVYREQKEYKGEDYHAYISGVEPRLDSLYVFPKTEIVTRDIIQKVPKKTRWGVGVQIGYGVGVVERKVVGTPYVGIGVSYNLFSW